MPVFVAIRTVQSTSAVSVDTVFPPSYSEIKSQLGTNVFKVYQLYLNSSSILQLNQKLQFNKYDADGSITANDLNPTVQPYQRSSTIFYKLQPFAMVDGRNSFSFNLLPGAQLQMIVFSQATETAAMKTPDGKAEALGPTNFERFETATGPFDFFGNFKSQIDDAETQS